MTAAQTSLTDITVVYTTYKRTQSLLDSINAIQRELPDLPIYIYADQCRNGASFAEQEAVRKHRDDLRLSFCNSQNIFLVFRSSNLGMRNAVLAVQDHITKGPVFFVEDDVVPLSGFSEFLAFNFKLHFRDPSITSICLFNPLASRLPLSRSCTITRTSMYATLIWNNKIPVVSRLRYNEIKLVKSDKAIQRRIVSLLSPEGLNFSLLDYCCRSFNALDCRFTFRQALYGTRGIVPPVSLAHNFGLSGDGFNCPDSEHLRSLFSVTSLNSMHSFSLTSTPIDYSYDLDCLAGHLSLSSSKALPRIYDCSDVWSEYVQKHLRSRRAYISSKVIATLKSYFKRLIT